MTSRNALNTHQMFINSWIDIFLCWWLPNYYVILTAGGSFQELTLELGCFIRYAPPLLALPLTCVFSKLNFCHINIWGPLKHLCGSKISFSFYIYFYIQWFCWTHLWWTYVATSEAYVATDRETVRGYKLLYGQHIYKLIMYGVNTHLPGLFVS